MQPELKPIPANDRVLGRGGPAYAPGSALPAVGAQKVLRNTQLLLALTMVPTAIGAYFGMATGGIIQQYPIISFFVMLGAVIGLQFAIAANRNSGLGVVFLLLMTGLLGWFIGPLLNYALALKNGAQLVGYAAGGTAATSPLAWARIGSTRLSGRRMNSCRRIESLISHWRVKSFNWPVAARKYMSQ